MLLNSLGRDNNKGCWLGGCRCCGEVVNYCIVMAIFFFWVILLYYLLYTLGGQTYIQKDHGLLRSTLASVVMTNSIGIVVLTKWVPQSLWDWIAWHSYRDIDESRWSSRKDPKNVIGTKLDDSCSQMNIIWSYMGTVPVTNMEYRIFVIYHQSAGKHSESRSVVLYQLGYCVCHAWSCVVIHHGHYLCVAPEVQSADNPPI